LALSRSPPKPEADTRAPELTVRLMPGVRAAMAAISRLMGRFSMSSALKFRVRVEDISSRPDCPTTSTTAADSGAMRMSTVVVLPSSATSFTLRVGNPLASTVMV